MKVRAFLALNCVLSFLMVSLSRPTTATSKPHLVVDDDKVECPNADFTRIQDAVYAATPGASIRICRGVYVEQVKINKPLDIDADSGAILMPAPIKQNTTSLFDASPLATAILVADTTDVSIAGLVVDGTNAGISECSPLLLGITFQNASGAIQRVTLRNFRLGPGFGGCQSGLGIFVQSGGGGISRVSIDKCTVHDFQKNGITANEVGTEVTIRGNVVTGIGPTTGAAQNGIQIGFGAGGSIDGNTVSNMVWSPCVSVKTCAAVATNILVTQSDGVEVTENTVGISQVGIFVHGNQGEVETNETFASSVFDGIRIEGDQGEVRSNHGFNGAEAGVFIAGNNNLVEHNTITEAAIGILKASGSSGNLIQGNRVFGTPIAVQDPSTSTLSEIISPVR